MPTTSLPRAGPPTEGTESLSEVNTEAQVSPVHSDLMENVMGTPGPACGEGQGEGKKILERAEQCLQGARGGRGTQAAGKKEQILDPSP